MWRFDSFSCNKYLSLVYRFQSLELIPEMEIDAIAKKHLPLSLTYKEFLQMNKCLTNIKLDHFYIMELIGEGSFGQVYKGTDDESKKEIAIKVLDLRQIELELNPKVKKIKRRLAKSESALMMKCDSPHILKCYRAYENKDLKIMIIEYCSGGTLQDEIDDKEKIPEQDAIAILKQLIVGIAECHRHKIVHRDLKAENIMIHNGVYKIADFGFSKQLQIGSEDQLSFNTCLGTLTTMAPEVMSRKEYGLKADIWSMGVIFFQMLFGTIPYKSNTSREMLLEMTEKQLANTEQYMGVRPSSQSREFLQKVMVVEPTKRLGWRDVLTLELFADKNGGRQLPEHFRRDANLANLDHQKLVEVPHKFESEMDQTNEQIEIKMNENVLGSKLKKVSPEEISNARKKVNNFDEKIYEWVKKVHVDCRKTEYILEKIISPLERLKLIDIQNRKHIEMMYLLCTRCLNNISPINVEKEKRKDNETIRDLLNEVSGIYKITTEKWGLYSSNLTAAENKYFSIISDFGSKIFKGSTHKEKDRYLTGIENMKEFSEESRIEHIEEKGQGSKVVEGALLDYEKKDQVDYTMKYINDFLKSNSDKQKSPEVRSLFNVMRHYQDICLIQLSDLKNKTFNDYVELILK